MLEYSDLTVVKNSAGTPTAMGYPINSFLLQNNKALFMGGGGGGTGRDAATYENLAVPAGLVCMTKTVCMKPEEYEYETDADANEMGSNPLGLIENDYEINADQDELVPEGLYERLMALAEVKHNKKHSKKNKKPVKKNKTHRHK